MQFFTHPLNAESGSVLQTSVREIKRLDSTVYSSIGEELSGLATIRAYRCNCWTPYHWPLFDLICNMVGGLKLWGGAPLE
jgi:hypothetical protein